MDHISYSQLNMFLRCGEQYRRRYVEGKIIPPSAALVRGKSCHKAEQINFRQKIETKIDLAVDDVKDAFATDWDENAYSIAWTEKELDGDSPKKAAGRFKDQGIALVEIFHIEQAPLARPVSIEDEFSVNFDGGYPPLIGYMDRIDEGRIIAEEKFVSKSPVANEILKDVQLTCYDMAYRSKHGHKPNELWKQWAVATKTPKTILQKALPRDDDTIHRFLWRLEAFLSALEKGIFLPAPNGHWCCSEAWCGYWHDCKYRQ